MVSTMVGGRDQEQLWWMMQEGEKGFNPGLGIHCAVYSELTLTLTLILSG